MCTEPNCEKKVHARGLCINHYRQLLRRERNGGIDGRGRHGNHVRGDDHHRFNHGDLVTSHGYVLVRVEEDHHLRQANGYAYEHQVVAEEMIGRRLQPDEVVHHRNKNTADNRRTNLLVLKRADHSQLHALERHSGLRPETDTLLDGEEWHQFPQTSEVSA